MILCFPTRETLQLILSSGIVPSDMALSQALAYTDDLQRVFIEAAVSISRDLLAELAKWNVTVVQQFPAKPQAVSCWPEVLPTMPDQSRVPDTTQPVLFELPDTTALPGLVREMLRLGNDRQSILLIDGRALLRVIAPPYYTLLRVLDQNTAPQRQPLRAYVEHAPRVWLELGFSHPLADRLRVPGEQLLLIAHKRPWLFLPELPFRDVYDFAKFPLPIQPQSLEVTGQLEPFTVALKLVEGQALEPAELWVFTDNAMSHVDQFVKETDERLVQQLRFAVAEVPDQPPMIIMKRLHSRGEVPAFSFPNATAYKPHSSVQHLYLPVGRRLRPTLRRDAIRKLLAEDDELIVWLHPRGQGGFAPHSIPETAFQPLEYWIEYVIDTAHVPLQEWVQSSRFDFDSFQIADDANARPPRDPGRGPKTRQGKGTPDEAPLTDVAETSPIVQMEPSTPVKFQETQRKNEKRPSEWKKLRDDLQLRFLACTGRLDQPERQEIWPELALANSGAGDNPEATLCWCQAIWASPGKEVGFVQQWLGAEYRDVALPITEPAFAKLLNWPDPLPGDVRKLLVVAYAVSLQPQPPHWFPPTIPALQKFIETQELKVPIRLVWLVSSRVARAAGADVLGLARLYDRLLSRLLEQGLNAEIDLPFFLRTAGIEDSERVRFVRDEASDLHEIVRKWSEAGGSRTSTTSVAPYHSTTAFVDLFFAFGMAKLGETQAATRLLESARSQFDSLNPTTDCGLASQWLYPAFKFRVEQALNGQPLTGRLPSDMIESLNDMNRRARGISNSPSGMAHFFMTRMMQQSRILEPYERTDPYKKFTVEHEGEFKKQLYELAQERDPSRLQQRIRDLYRAEGDKADVRSKANTNRVTEKQFLILLDALPLSGRCGRAFVAELIRIVPAALQQPFPQLAELSRKQALLLERALFLAGHFDLRELISQLMDSFLEVLGTKPDEQRFEVINEVAREGVRSLRKLGLREETDRLLQRLLALVVGKGQYSDLKVRYSGKPEQRVKALVSMLSLAGGWLSLGSDQIAHPILDEARLELLSASTKPMPQDYAKLAVAYVNALGQGPTDVAFSRIRELFEQLSPTKITNSFTTAPYFSRLHLNVVEEVVLMMVSDESSLGTAGRRWLEEDEFLVRQRLHADMKHAMQIGGLSSS